MRKLQSHLPRAGRSAVREGYRLADEILKANADVVRRIADELLARRWTPSLAARGGFKALALRLSHFTCVNVVAHATFGQTW